MANNYCSKKSTKKGELKMYLTRGINEKIASDLDFSKFIINSMKRFNSRDWGDLCEEDKV